MCVLRADYMIDWPQDYEAKLKLVEYNTIAVSMLPVSYKVSLIHNYILNKYKPDLLLNYPHNQASPPFPKDYSQLDALVVGFVQAINLYK